MRTPTEPGKLHPDLSSSRICGLSCARLWPMISKGQGSIVPLPYTNWIEVKWKDRVALVKERRQTDPQTGRGMDSKDQGHW